MLRETGSVRPSRRVNFHYCNGKASDMRPAFARAAAEFASALNAESRQSGHYGRNTWRTYQGIEVMLTSFSLPSNSFANAPKFERNS